MTDATRRSLERAWRQGDPEACVALCSEDVRLGDLDALKGRVHAVLSRVHHEGRPDHVPPVWVAWETIGRTLKGLSRTEPDHPPSNAFVDFYLFATRAFALAVRVGDRVTFGAATVRPDLRNPSRGTTPAVAWPELEPWTPLGPRVSREGRRAGIESSLPSRPLAARLDRWSLDVEKPDRLRFDVQTAGVLVGALRKLELAQEAAP